MAVRENDPYPLTMLLPYREGEHSLYSRLRDRSDPHSVELRQLFSTLWQQYAPFAPKSFLKKLQIEFHQRWWEMCLVVGMLHLDLAPASSMADIGPDVSLTFEDQLVFVEATAPSVGTTTDRVPEPVCNGVSDLPERECLLRLTQALTDKCVKLHGYIEAGVIPPNACSIIALSASNLNQFGTLLDGTYPAPLSVLAGAGHTVITIGGEVPPHTSTRSTLYRDCGSEVNATLFENQDFSIISGVLYSPVDLWNTTLKPEDSISLFVNPQADHPIPDAFKKRFACWTQEKPSRTEAVWSCTQRSFPPNSGLAR